MVSLVASTSPKLERLANKMSNSVSNVHTIISNQDGVYKICLEGTKSLFQLLPTQELRLSVKILNEVALDRKLQEAMTAEDFKESRDIMMKLMSETSDILIQQDYKQKKEQIFINYQTQLDSRTYYLTMLQMGIMVVSSVWVIYSLRNFMNRK